MNKKRGKPNPLEGSCFIGGKKGWVRMSKKREGETKTVGDGVLGASPIDVEA